MCIMLNETDYNPDVLACLANLSNDEVFTPPAIANKVLDSLPSELWKNPNTKILEPVSKSGVFLREIAKRLISGLKHEIPQLEVRLNHIFEKQLFAISITELTALVSRRSLYCSKFANKKISQFTNAKNKRGNIFFSSSEHSWKAGRCIHCGASKVIFEQNDELENHAYQFIHNQIPGEIKEMKFDVIIGNPPYQLETGGSNRQATPIYNKFVEQAKKLNPRYLTMIIPARWYAGGMGLNDFRKKMISDKRIKELHDFPVTSDCFPGINIRGGVCYFLWSRDYEGACDVYNWHNGESNKTQRYLNEYGDGVFLRYNSAISILSKIKKLSEPTFERYVSSQKPFGLPTNFSEYSKQRTNKNNIELYKSGGVVYTSRAKIKNGEKMLEKFKIFIGKASPGADTFPHLVISKPVIGKPGSACTETYLALYETKDVDEINNVAIYLQTKLAKFMILMMKPTQDVLKKSYSLLPVQDFSKSTTDDELFKKYGITDEEIVFIDSLVK